MNVSVIFAAVLALFWNNSLMGTTFAADDSRTTGPTSAQMQTLSTTAEGRGQISLPDPWSNRAVYFHKDIDLWSCCRSPAISLRTPEDGITMRETLYLLSIQVALQTAGDALSVRKETLSRNRARAKRVRFEELTNDLLEAKRDLAAQSKALAGDVCRGKDVLLRAMKDAEHVVNETLDVQRRFGGRARPDEKDTVRKKLQLIHRHIDNVLAESRKIPNGLMGEKGP